MSVTTLARCAATTFIMATGLGLGSVGAATVAAAQVGEFPSYHWCPGQEWHPEWGLALNRSVHRLDQVSRSLAPEDGVGSFVEVVE